MGGLICLGGACRPWRGYFSAYACSVGPDTTAGEGANNRFLSGGLVGGLPSWCWIGSRLFCWRRFLRDGLAWLGIFIFILIFADGTNTCSEFTLNVSHLDYLLNDGFDFGSGQLARLA